MLPVCVLVWMGVVVYCLAPMTSAAWTRGVVERPYDLSMVPAIGAGHCITAVRRLALSSLLSGMVLYRFHNSDAD